MRIIKNGRNVEIACKNCKSLLEISDNDIKKKHGYDPDIEKVILVDYIICPVCHNQVFINKREAE